MKLAVVFPGQGAQRVGMGEDWLPFDVARQVFTTADDALGFELSKLCFNGPEEELKYTANAQPAILAASYAVYQVLRDDLPPVACFAGHSLGEYTALVAAEALPLADALTTVNERGRLMQEAVPAGQGAMAAVIGLDAEQVVELCNEVSAEANAVVELANLNSPEQVVISGDSGSVARAMAACSKAGAKRVVPLAVSAPFHCALMVPAANNLLPLLKTLPFEPAKTPVIANFTVQPYPADTTQYAATLHAQIFNPVRWTETVYYFRALGITHVLELGPGKVLRMLVAKTDRSIHTNNLEHAKDLDAVREWLAGLTAPDREDTP